MTPSKSSFFAPRSSGSSSSSSAAESDLQAALRISAAEARIAGMSEEELLQEALRASEVECVAPAVAVEQQGQVDEDVGQSKRESPRKRRKMKYHENEGRGDAAKENGDYVEEVAGPSSDKRMVSDQVASGSNRSAPVAPLFASSFKVAAPSFPKGSSELTSTEPDVIKMYDGSLDLLYARGWIAPDARRQLLSWMLNEFNWHRVSYKRAGGITITTPRYTTTFGRDDTTAPDSAYPIVPKAWPKPLDELRQRAEKLSNAHFNTCIINYYADGKDSISYHSDDERFLGDLPTIASISLGSTRDFYLRRKAPQGQAVPAPLPNQRMGTKGAGPAAERPTEKYKLSDGDLIVMRGRTQAEWEHAIPKRAKAGGRINITFRRVMSVEGTNNFQRYNRGDGPTLRWKGTRMVEGSGGL